MLSGFEKSVADFLRANGLVKSGDKIVLAVSGGADSLALLCCLSALRAAGLLDAALTIGHINHQLRGADADADERFVAERAKDLQLPVVIKRIDVGRCADEKKLSIETAARKLRTEALMDIARQAGCNLIATGHNKNDNAETIVQRLRRGTGLRGLAGIWPKKSFPENITFIRPLLWAGRDEIIQYLRHLGRQWRHDRTNIDTAYTRNYIRHRLLPELQAQCRGRIIEQLSELARHCRAYHCSVMEKTEKTWLEVVTTKGPCRVEFDIKVFTRHPPWVKVALARKALLRLGCGERALTRLHYEKILNLADENIAGRQITLPGKFTVTRFREALAFTKKQPQVSEPAEQSAVLNIPGRTEFGDWLIEAGLLDARKCDLEKFKASKSAFVEWFDFDELSLPLQIRRRRLGDRFRPLGLGAEKKIGKFLTSARVGPDSRRRLIIIADAEKIIWLAPIRPGEKTKITSQTKNVLQIQLTSRH